MEGCNGGMGIVQWVMVEKKKKENGYKGKREDERKMKKEKRRKDREIK